MRAVTIMDLPVAEPFTCIKCGLGTNEQRRHYVDIGVSFNMQKDVPTGIAYIGEGVIYLCNMCMMSTIADYLGQLFNFVSNQETTIILSQQQRQEQLDMLHNEIFSLRDQLNNRDLEVKNLEAELVGYKQVTAEELLGKVLDGRDTDNADGSDSDAEGTTQDSDGNDPAAESNNLTASDLFDLNLRFAADHNS